MEKTRLGMTELMVSRTSFGGIPIQRISYEESTEILCRAYDGGVNFFDTARGYGTSENRIGKALGNVRNNIIIATKTSAKTAQEFESQLDKSLSELGCDYIDIYQFHNPAFTPSPNTPDGLYEAALSAKKKGKIRHIGITSHNIALAKEMVESGLFSTMQFPFSSLASREEIALVELCEKHDVGFVAMKAMAGGLIASAKSAFAFLRQYKNVVPIWGIQFLWELDEFLDYENNPPSLGDELWEIINKDRAELSDEFCRACGYCLPCPAEINIPMAARTGLLLRRMDINNLINDDYKKMMRRINDCTGCNHCISNCPYSLKPPELLAKHLEIYENYLHTAKIQERPRLQ